MYYDILGKPLPVSPTFKEDGSEGKRVGYFCPSCEESFPISTSKLQWDHSGVASNGVCPCGGSVMGIYRTKPTSNPKERVYG